MIKNGFYWHFPEEEVRVISYGVPRSGSTLIYQILVDLFPDGVVKCHSYFDLPCPVIVSYRDYRDATVSMWRCHHPGATRMTEADILEWAPKFLHYAQLIRQYRASHRGRIVELRYEDFVGEPMRIFDGLEPLLGLRLERPVKEAILARHSLETNRRIAARFEGFHQQDPASEIHGNHIHEAKVGSWRAFVDDAGSKTLDEILGAVLEEFGYPVPRFDAAAQRQDG